MPIVLTCRFSIIFPLEPWKGYFVDICSPVFVDNHLEQKPLNTEMFCDWEMFEFNK